MSEAGIQYIKASWHRLRVFEAVSHTNKGSDRKMSIITLGKNQLNYKISKNQLPSCKITTSSLKMTYFADPI